MKLALWQTQGHPADVTANLAALELTAREARAQGAELLLCPECWLAGYHIGDDIERLAEPADGPAARRIAAVARDNGLAIAYGYAERDGAGAVFNSTQVLGSDGELLARYRKTHLFGPDERAHFRPGTGFAPPFRFRGLTIGLLICYDVEYPECVRSLALMGAQLILVPTALTDEYSQVPDIIVPARSLENVLFIAYCNRAGRENGMAFLGRSCVIGPDGHALAAAQNDETLLIADIEQSVCVAASRIYPYREDRRPELYGRVSQLDV
jgi:predicted amidohydrolase